jgi:hypothetical protein
VPDDVSDSLALDFTFRTLGAGGPRRIGAGLGVLEEHRSRKIGIVLPVRGREKRVTLDVFNCSQISFVSPWILTLSE